MTTETLATAFERQATRTPDRPAMRWDSGARTYAELRDAMLRRAGVLEWIKLRPGDRLALALPNGPDYLEIVLAVAHAGMILVPLDPRLTDAELERRLEHAGCRALIWRNGVRRMLDRDASPLEAAASDVAGAWAIAYTSGSTGEPKAAILSHRAKVHSAVVEAREYGTGEGSVVLVNTPLFHVHALVHAFTALLHGGCVSVARRFDPADTLETIASHRVTEISMVPTMYRDLLAAGPSATVLAPLRVARCTGAALPDDVRAELVERLGRYVHVLYGATEAGGITNLRPEDGARKPGSVGRPFEGVDIEVRDGRVYMRGQAQFSGFHRGPAHRPGVDWLTLNDLGYVDADGFLYLTGRADDAIVSGGEKIDPLEVERALRAHPAVADAAVLAVADPRLGQSVAAIVVLRPGAHFDVDVDLNEHLPRFSRPRQVVVVGAIPRNAMGKLDRAAADRLLSSH